ncbi:MAG: nucleotidyltransferase domain-containing protein [Cyanobacteria bacterium P01_C01_bin.120]
MSHWIQVMTQRIIDQFEPLQIILFGLYARGDAQPCSDVDLLVVLPEVDSKRQQAIAISAILTDLPIAKDIIVTTPQEIEAYGDLVGTILRPALRKGKLLYDRATIS